MLGVSTLPPATSVQLAKNVFRYLAEYTQLRTRQQRNMDTWDLSWVHSWPSGTEVTNALLDSNDILSTGTLLSVKRPQRPSAPPPSAGVACWLDLETLSDSTLEAPLVLRTISVPSDAPKTDDEGNSVSVDPIVMKLDDSPGAYDEVQRYISRSWLPWAQTDRNKAAIQSLYGQLFSWRQRQIQLGEQWEMILGVGTLVWKDQDTQEPIRRPLLTIPVTVEMDAGNGSINVSLQSDANPALELDMLPITRRPDPDATRMMHSLVADCGGELVERSSAGGVLTSIAFVLAADGSYDNTLMPASSADSHPQITYSPVLVMRKRGEKSISSLLASIESQVTNEQSIPPALAVILGVPSPATEDAAPAEIGDEVKALDQDPLLDGMVFFPKKSNDEQRMIVTKLAQAEGGLIVQGPPGTGKSHTITNLVCDLLARGNRVLVTSKGARALHVLRDMLPPELQSLCVLLLGSDHESNMSLEMAVSSISAKYEAWRPEAAAESRRRLLTNYHEGREAVQTSLARLRELRQAETEQTQAVPGAYEGTRASVAQRVHEESHEYGWIAKFFTDDTDPGACPLSQDECNSAAPLARSLTLKYVDELALSRPALAALPDAETFRSLVAMERESLAALGTHEPESNGFMWPQDPSTIKSHAIDAKADLAAVTQIVHQQERFGEMLRNVLAGDTAATEQEAQYLDGVLSEIEQLGTLDLEIESPSDKSIAQIRTDATRLCTHLECGKSLGIGPFRSKLVKECLYLVEETRIDGALCAEASKLKQVAAAIEIEQTLRAATLRLSNHGLGTGPSQTARVSDLRTLRRRISMIVDAAARVSNLRKECSDVDFGFSPNLTSDAGLEEVISAAEIAARQLRHTQSTERLHRVAETATACGPSPHPLVPTLVVAIENRDSDAYEGVLADLDVLERSQLHLAAIQPAFEALSERSRALANHLFGWGEGPSAVTLTQLPVAWNWLRAELWLRRVCNPTAHEEVSQRLEEQQGHVDSTVATLAAELAWSHCLSKMTDAHRGHLVAWAREIKKLGKGTGKHAPLHRNAAREHMQYCKDVIPAWIMPLYKVAETLDPKPAMFDVAIVDEASQSGPEALFVTYIAKKVIVVGDDQQISPDDVGVSVDAVQDLVNLYLSEMPFKGVFGVGSSLFDLGKQYFGHPLRLREHFRCMPEIIQFSNNLCYADQPLEPLRQYGADRLPPIMVEHVSQGYQEDGKGTVNPPEAKAIVEKIVSLCKDPAYDGLTMGVISLLSTSKQALLVERLLLERIGAEEIRRRKIICGDAYDFQGDERDIIFLSMVNANNQRIGVLSSESHKRRFNVAVSRAKDQLWLFHSVVSADLSHACFRRQLLEYCLEPRVGNWDDASGLDIDALRRRASKNRTLGNQPEPFDSWFELDVFLLIVGRGYRVIPQYKSGGYFIDLMVQGIEGCVAVECDGETWHGPEQYDADVARQRKLERCGLPFWRVTESSFRRNPTKAMEGLWERLADLKVYSSVASRDLSADASPTHSGTTARDDVPTYHAAERPTLPEVMPSASAPIETPHVQSASASAGSGATRRDEASLSMHRQPAVSTPVIDRPALPERAKRPATNLGRTRANAYKECDLVCQSLVSLRPYTAWIACRLPNTARCSLELLRDSLLEIIEAEGPIAVERLCALYFRNSPSSASAGPSERVFLDTALTSMARSGAISRRTEYADGGEPINTVHVTGQPDILARDRGPRGVMEIPPLEMLEVLRQIHDCSPDATSSNKDAVASLSIVYAITQPTTEIKEQLAAVAAKYLNEK